MNSKSEMKRIGNTPNAIREELRWMSALAMTALIIRDQAIDTEACAKKAVAFAEALQKELG